jgi:hypothetical protein
MARGAKFGTVEVINSVGVVEFPEAPALGGAGGPGGVRHEAARGSDSAKPEKDAFWWGWEASSVPRLSPRA